MSAPDPNRSVVEAESLRPRLRDDLRFSIQEQGGDRVCVIEDRAAWKFHRVGLAEYRFIRSLDGGRTVAAILARLARDGDAAGFTAGEALQMIRWLKDSHLLAVESSRPVDPSAAAHRTLLGALTWLNPLVAKLPLARPDGFFTAVERPLRRALGWLGFVVWLVAIFTGGTMVAMEWPRFTRGFDGILARENWLWLLLAWAALKLLHELSHGLFCKHFGAAVRELGVIFVVFIPMGYVDASASLGLASKWRRIMISAAGLYAEFFIAALAAILWACSADGRTATLAHDVVFTGTVVTLLLNANPLMRFDGYYILGDLLALPNLATRGRAWVRAAAARVFLGPASPAPAPLRSREDLLIAGYGVAAALWQMLVFAGLLVAASATLRGGGLLFAVLAAALWLGVPLWQFARAFQSSGISAARIFSLVSRLAIAAAILAALWLVPFRRTVSSAGVIEPAEAAVLRAECPGFVREVRVHDGENVAAGQVLLELVNEDATAEVERARLDLAQQELRARIAYAHHELTAFQAETAKAAAWRSSLAQREAYLATLRVRAPFAGRITGRQLANLPGSFLHTGDEIAQLGRAGGGDVRLALDQEAAAHFRASVGEPVRVRIVGGAETFTAQLTRVEARATREIIHPALTALAGGPLALRRTERDSAETSRDAYELAEPHFAALARLAAPPPAFTGQLALVKLRSARGVSLWESAQAGFARWLHRRMARE